MGVGCSKVCQIQDWLVLVGAREGWVKLLDRNLGFC